MRPKLITHNTQAGSVLSEALSHSQSGSSQNYWQTESPEEALLKWKSVILLKRLSLLILMLESLQILRLQIFPSAGRYDEDEMEIEFEGVTCFVA
jgi:hypothetical protein